MGFKRKPPTSLLPNRGPAGDGCAGEITTQASPPLPKPQPAQTRSSSTPSQPPSPRSKLPPPPYSVDPKWKRASKGKEPVDGGRSRSSQEEDETRRASKQLKVGHQDQGKEVTTQSEPLAWLLTLMLYREPLMDNASLRDFQNGEGTYMVNALEKSLLLPADMAELKNLRR